MYRFLVITFLFSQISFTQDSTSANPNTTTEDVALVSMTGFLISMAVAGTVVGMIPPSYTVVSKDGILYSGINFESGFGIGEKRETGVFSDWRIGLSYSYIISSRIRDIARVELKRDFHFDFVDRRKIFLAGGHVSVGAMSDFPNHGYTAGAGLWVKSPWLSFFGFIPQHTFGITYRYNKYFKGKYFNEFSLGVTSAFTF